MGFTNRWLDLHGIIISTWEGDPFCHHPEYKGAVTIASGSSPRGPWTHSVVWKDEKVLFDPHPSRAGLVGKPLTWEVLLVTDASKLRNLLMDTVYEKAMNAANLVGVSPPEEVPSRDVTAFKEVAELMVPSSANGWNHLIPYSEKVIPLVKQEDKLLRVKPCHIFDESYTWGDRGDQEEVTGLVPFASFKTLHYYGHYALFKPSIGEVLAQIPDKHRDCAVAFSLDGPDSADDLNKEKLAVDAGFHVATCTLYKKEEV